MTRTRSQAGMSLIELTIAVSILGLVMAAITTTMIVAMRATAEATDRLDRGNDQQLTSAHFGPDVAGALEVTAVGQPGFTGPTTEPGCGPTGDRLVVQFRGREAIDVLTSDRWTVSYVLTDGGATLARRACTGSATTPASDVAVAAGLSTTSGPTVACRTAAGAAVACEDPSAQGVTLDLTIEDGTERSTTGSRRTT